MSFPVNLEALIPVARALEHLRIEYYIGGSIASSAHGVGRSTLDIDVVAHIRIEDADRLAGLLENEYYVDAQMIRDAIRARRSFNVIHDQTAYKVDIFVMKPRAFDQAARKRVVTARVPPGGEHSFPLASPEDTILNKLEWYRIGDDMSERQWHDIMGVVNVQWNNLDRAYLTKWAHELNVADLLERAWKEAQPIGESV